jgi:Zn-dependent protease
LEFTLIQKIIVWTIPVLFAITLHEVAHGWVASLLGDPTAKMLGRLSLNPIRHIDPIGTVAIPVLLLLTVGFVFGYARPVPVTWENLKNPKRDMAIVALAGPMANLFMAIFWIIVIRIGLLLHSEMASLFLIAIGMAGIFINLILMVLNLLPLPPLDGGRIMVGLLPSNAARQYAQLEPWGMIILVVLMVTGLLGQIIGPPIYSLFGMMADMAGISGGKFVAMLHLLGLLKTG